MNLRDLQYLVAVADTRNFSQAAMACHVSQPTLSGQLKKLEQYLGLQLFERTNKKVLPTPAALPIIAKARQTLSNAEQLEELAIAAKNPMSGPFRLGAFPTIASYIFPDIVAGVKAEQRLADLKLILVEEKTDTLLAQLKQGQLDAALLALPIKDDNLEIKPLFEDPFYLAVPTGHPLAVCKTVKQAVLAEYPLLLLEEGHCLRDQALAVCQLAGGSDTDFRATSLETLRQMVRAGTGLTLMPNIAIQPQHQQDADIKYLPFAESANEPAPRREIALVWRKTFSRQEVLSVFLTILC